MPRVADNSARRRLANIYESDRRRALAVANARDRNRRGGDDQAPRKFVVSERRTRQAGFGRGGVQARGGSRRRNNNNDRGGRFADRGVFRRGNRDRFERDDDIDRRRRRDRRVDNNNGNRGGRRFADRRDRRDRVRGGRNNNNNRRGNNNNNKDRNLDDELDRYKGRGGDNKQRNNNRGGRGGGRKAPVTKDDLDAQLENFRTALTPAAAPTI